MSQLTANGTESLLKQAEDLRFEAALAQFPDEVTRDFVCRLCEIVKGLAAVVSGRKERLGEDDSELLTVCGISIPYSEIRSIEVDETYRAVTLLDGTTFEEPR